jgi:hypothetical protein
MKLDELLDRKVAYEVLRDKPDLFVTKATIGERDIVFSAEQFAGDDGLYWGVAFEEHRDGDHTYAATGSGDEFKVTSMVAASMKEFLQRYSPERVTFSAEKTGPDDPRVAIYRRLADKLLRDYTRSEFDSGVDTSFKYVRK